MTKLNSALAVFAALSLTACATAAPPILLTSPYDAMAHNVQPGGNTISGNAVLRTVGGDVKTCAGFPVKLVPATAYSSERMAAIYGGGDRGYMPLYAAKTFSPPNPHYDAQAGRTETCDSQGNFAFERISDGTYYLVSIVTWGVPQQYYTAQQGGALMMKVSVNGGETKRIVLTQ